MYLKMGEGPEKGGRDLSCVSFYKRIVYRYIIAMPLDNELKK